MQGNKNSLRVIQVHIGVYFAIFDSLTERYPYIMEENLYQLNLIIYLSFSFLLVSGRPIADFP